MICRKFIISGRVQGVFFRASTRDKAKELKLTGYAINLENGDVEVLACGEEDNVHKLQVWLNLGGSPMAVVNRVYSEEVAFEEHSDFKTG